LAANFYQGFTFPKRADWSSLRRYRGLIPRRVGSSSTSPKRTYGQSGSPGPTSGLLVTRGRIALSVAPGTSAFRLDSFETPFCRPLAYPSVSYSGDAELRTLIGANAPLGAKTIPVRQVATPGVTPSSAVPGSGLPSSLLDGTSARPRLRYTSQKSRSPISSRHA